MAKGLKEKLISVTSKMSTDEQICSTEQVWELCHQAAFEIRTLENKVLLMENSFKAEVAAALDCEDDSQWNLWAKEMMVIMNYGENELGYRTGESERIALAVTNSELRSEILELHHNISKMYNRLLMYDLMIKSMCDFLESGMIDKALSIGKDLLKTIGDKNG